VTRYDEKRLGELLSSLPPAPGASVQAAKDLPLLRRGLGEILERAAADEEYRRRVVEDPRTALLEADVVAHTMEDIEILRRRLKD
jgi:hypothetical protein